MTGREAFLALLRDEGVSHLFGNPGTTELPVMHALKEFPDLTYVMAMQESLVVAMADGFSRASGQLVAANVHVAPGLGNAMGALYSAKFTGTPMILTAGQQEQGHGLMEPMLYDALVPIAAPLVKWAVEVTRLEDLPRIVRRAAKVATTAPTGPVFISLPGDILNAEAGIDLGGSTRIDTRVRPSAAALEKLARRILAAERPVMIAGDELVKSDGLSAAARFAETIGAAVYQQAVNWGAHFPSEHPCYIGAPSRDQPRVRRILDAHDLLIVAGADPLRMSVMSETDPKPDHLAVVQIGLIDWDIAKNFAVEIALKADVAETLSALTDEIVRIGGAGYGAKARARVAALASDNWTTRRARLVAEIETRAAAKPIDPDLVALRVASSVARDGILVDEALTTGRHIPALYHYRDRYGYHGLASGGIGWGLPGAVGVSLANPGRRVTAFSGDGSAMYSIQALWTAAHHKLPITFVIANNGGYRIIKQRLKSFHSNDHFIGMDFTQPDVDFTSLAMSLGVPAETVTEPDRLAAALADAPKTPGPKLLNVICDGRV
jgi:benzoylformate decarboxylase